jgi:hypothetical protein
VHGNEFASTEIAYELVNAANSVSRKELESTIVILDLALILTDILDMEIGSEKFQEKRILNCQIENIWKYGLEVDTIIIYLT